MTGADGLALLGRYDAIDLPAGQFPRQLFQKLLAVWTGI
jgi:hypothetical protein